MNRTPGMFLWLCGSFLLTAIPLFGNGHKMDSEKFPINPDFVALYEKNKAAIQSMTDEVKKSDLSEAQRLKVFKQLRAKYPDHALGLAADLVAAKADSIALFSVQLLGGAAVMSDHRMPADGHGSPVANYAMQRHEYARKALRKAQADERKQIRDWATQTLASLSDKAGLENVAKGAKDGRYSALDAVNHFGLAKPEVGIEYIAPYLNSKNGDVQAAAVEYLVTSPTYRKRIRDDILLGGKGSMESRLAAAKSLATDPKTALLVLGNVETPPLLFEEVFLTYLKASGPRYSLAELKAFRAIVENYKKVRDFLKMDKFDFKAIDKTLKNLEMINSP